MKKKTFCFNELGKSGIKRYFSIQFWQPKPKEKITANLAVWTEIKLQDKSALKLIDFKILFPNVLPSSFSMVIGN